MKNRYVVIFSAVIIILIVVAIYFNRIKVTNIVGPSNNVAVGESNKNMPILLDEAAQKSIIEDFKVKKQNKDVDFTDLVKIINDNKGKMSKDNFTQLLMEYELAQKCISDYDYYIDRDYFKPTVEYNYGPGGKFASLILNYRDLDGSGQGLSKEDRAYVEDTINRFKNLGFDIIVKEGLPYLNIDYSFYSRYNGHVTDYFERYVNALKNLKHEDLFEGEYSYDVPLDSIFKFIENAEVFIDSSKQDDIRTQYMKAQYRNKTTLIINYYTIFSEGFDSVRKPNNKKIDSKYMEFYTRIFTTGNSKFSNLFKSYYEVLEKNNYILNKEVFNAREKLLNVLEKQYKNSGE